MANIVVRLREAQERISPKPEQEIVLDDPMMQAASGGPSSMDLFARTSGEARKFLHFVQWHM
jgi:hypothetical protein